MTTEQALDLVRRILASFPTQRQRMSPDDVKGMGLAYVDGLLDLDYERTRMALVRVVRTSRFLPTVAEIRESAMDVEHGTRKTGGQAWGECIALIEKYGSHRWPGIDFPIDDALIAQTIRAFGWLNLCKTEGDAAKAADRARWIELYENLSKGERKETQIAQGLTPALPAASATPALAGTTTPIVDPVDPEEARKLFAELARNLGAEPDKEKS